MNPTEYRINLIELSFSKLKKNKDLFSEHFYTRLFEQSPQLKPLFAHTTIKAQGAKLYAALVLLVENLRHPKELERVLLPLGKRHIGYGVIEQHYPIVCDILLETLAFFLKSEWTPEVKMAWEKTLEEVTQTMLIGAGVQPSTIKKEVVKTGVQKVKKNNQFELVENTFEKIKPLKKEFAETFYTDLFKSSPELKPLFKKTDMKKQTGKLYGALLLLVENIRKPEELERVLLPLGKRHIAYGVIEPHYPIVCDTLLDTLALFLKSEWTPEVRIAWKKTLDDVTRTMLLGAGVQPSTVKKEVVKTGGHKVKNNIQFELVENSFEKIKPRRKEFAEAFYDNLFIISPELKPLFKHTDFHKQTGKLYGALLLLVENIRKPEALEVVLVPLGKRHIAYGTIDAHYPIVGTALIQTLESYLKSDWTPELEEAWKATYQVAADLMMEGASNATAISKENNNQETTTIAAPNSDTKEKNSKLSSKQISQRSSKNPLLTKANNWFWETPKWKMALGIAIFFILLVPLDSRIPIIKEFLDIVEPLSIIIALILYIKESPERKKQFHYQAWSTIDAANGIKNSYARIIALQDLCDDNVSLKGLDLTGAELSGIELNGCDLSNTIFLNAALNNAELYNSDLNNADLSNSSSTSIVLTKSNLGFANLHKANFSSADFSGANLMFADMSEGNFSGANFSNAKLKGANFEGAYFSGANLKGADINLDEIEQAYLVKTIMPDGSIHE